MACRRTFLTLACLLAWGGEDALSLSFLSQSMAHTRLARNYGTMRIDSSRSDGCGPFPLHMVLSDKSANVEDEKATRPELFDKLDNAFHYEGRIPAKTNYRCGFVSVLGAPNMGKSTLVNALLEEDLCVATRRPQTTRHAILGVMTTPDCQLCLVDTPGIIDHPAYKLQEGMMEAVMGSFYDADVHLVVTDLFSTPIPNDHIFQKVQSSHKPLVVAIHKVDLLGKANQKVNDDEDLDKTYSVEDAIARWRSLLPNAIAILPLSSAGGIDNEGVIALRKLLTGDDGFHDAIRSLGRPIPGMFAPGVKFPTLEDIRRMLPESPPLYDEETITDRSERFFASEIIRGALFESLKKELPYCCEVRIEQFKEPKEGGKKGTTRIEATIFVERESQKGIVVGKGGEMIKNVGILAREKLEDVFLSRVFLDLKVKVSKDWRRNDDKLREYGYKA